MFNSKVYMHKNWVLLTITLLLPIMAACTPVTRFAPAPPTADPAIYNQVPDTTVYEPGECTAVLETPAPAHTSNTLGGQPNGEIPAGEYEVGVAADYGSSLWFMLNDVGETNWINSSSVAALEGACAQ